MLASPARGSTVQPRALPSAAVSGIAPAVATVDSLRLLHGHRELLIRHGDEVYRLRHTRNNKLILTK